MTYGKYQRLLFGALARLARVGYVVSPDDGMDLVHEFFTDSWKTIRADFDPNRGTKLETYVFQVFIHFSRPRIKRIQRWQTIIMDNDDLTHVIDDTQLCRSSADDVISIRKVILLKPIERKVVVSY